MFGAPTPCRSSFSRYSRQMSRPRAIASGLSLPVASSPSPSRANRHRSSSVPPSGEMMSKSSVLLPMSMTPVFTLGCYPGHVAEDPNEVLKRQIEYFSSDQLLRDRAAPYRDMTPGECWAETRELCGMLDWFLARMEPDVRAR